MARETGIKRVAENRKAYHDYFIDETFEAGIALVGTEVKSLREGRINLRDSYVEVRGSATRPSSSSSAPTSAPTTRATSGTTTRCGRASCSCTGTRSSASPARCASAGYTVVPTKVYFKDGRAKVEIGLARGKKLYDKRHDMADRDAKRDVERALRGRGEDRR